ncbi:CAP domain-containing protein [Edaphobacter bradus]|uniref:CAP domain-containing protein n=1 Tax=Edaphobacter bradus TaxID=2259016 RepID=UPI0021DF440C|nr:CAP domain-containing protein [Edaphobacter bradus]
MTFLAAFMTPGLAVKTTGNPTNVAEQFLLASANQDRVARGLHQLQFDPVLAQAALFHANEMADHDGISHQFPGEPDLAERGAAAGAHFSLITENVAEAADSSIIHDLWMHSPGHRANLLDPEVEVVGIAVVVRNHQFYAVEDFANTVESLSFTEQESSVADLLAHTGLQVINETDSKTVSVDDARKTCSMSSGYAGQRKPWFIMRFTADKLDRLPDELESRIGTGKYHQALIGACADDDTGSFTGYNIAVLLYP